MATRGQAEAEAELRDDDDYQVVLREAIAGDALVQNFSDRNPTVVVAPENYRNDKKAYPPPYVP